MNTKYTIIYLLLILVSTGCKEEFVGQYPVDTVAPQPVSNIKIENLPGKAILTYTLPEEDDLLCVKAKYTLTNGQYMEMSSSAYVNKLELPGFGKSKKCEVVLVTIDKSFNESTPVVIEIEPKDSPIYDIIKTLKVQASFGGLKLSWDNPLKENIVMGVMSKNEDGEYREIDIIYSSEDSANRAVRGLDATPTDFGFYFRDTHNNHTDTIYQQFTPIFEEEIDKSKFMALPLSKKFKFHSYGGGKMDAMWDKVYNKDDNLCYINVADEEIYFAFDVGTEAQLSRFRLWTRRNFIYQLHHLRKFEIWGTCDQNATKDPDNWDGWYKIMDCESIRPSGKDAGGDPTGEEIEYVTAGEEWEVPLEAPKTRYIKILVHTTWSNSTAAFINEITLWGSTK